MSHEVGRTLRRIEEEERLLQAFLRGLQSLIPEPPVGWKEAAKPPGSAPRTGGRP